MTTGRFNIVLGLVAMILAGFTGFALGLTLEQYFQNGYAQIPFWRQLTKVGHSHGMPFGMINILFGLIISHATCSIRLKRIGAITAALALFLPVGVSLRGLTEGAVWAHSLAILGGGSLLAACVTMIFIVANNRKESIFHE
jgi:hypothetical protein